MEFNNIIKYIILTITIWNSLFINNDNEINIIYYLEQFRRNNFPISTRNIPNFSDINFNVTEINFTYSNESGLIETILTLKNLRLYTYYLIFYLTLFIIKYFCLYNYTIIILEINVYIL